MSLLNKIKTPGLKKELLHEDFFNALREKEYSRLDKEGQVYLDYTGGNLYAESQIKKHFEVLKNNTFGNPHSTNPTSKLSTQLVEEARAKVLDFFNAQDYYCVFTQNASMALKIVGECYPFEEKGEFLLLTDNHNSVNGIREYCAQKGGHYAYVPMNFTDLSIPEDILAKKLENSSKSNKLFAFPAQSNVSGVKHSLEWIEKAQSLGWDVLLDAAAYVPSSRLDLKQHKPNYVSISFYKIFGYPTGIGCLLIRKDSFSKLHKNWFAGGTVSFASAVAPYHFLFDNHERFENGTLNYIDIPAVKIGLDYIEAIGMNKISERVASLKNYLYSHLVDLKHESGQNQVEIFGLPESAHSGGTLVMTFKNPDGSKIAYEKIEQLANTHTISIRSGCFCNPGLDETTNCLTSDEIAKYFSSPEKIDYDALIRSLKLMRGATRVSVGLATNKKDLDAFIDFVIHLKDQRISHDAFSPLKSSAN